MMTIYDLKPKFQNLLRPLTRCLAANGVTANAVTLTAMILSILTGCVLLLSSSTHVLFLLLPVWMFLRMGLNAIDGMLAREFGQKSALGAYLNELSDVVSDAALYLPFAFVSPFSWKEICAIIFLSVISEMAGALGPMIGGQRRYDGPIGKSDRAFIFGTLGLYLALTPNGQSLPPWLWWGTPIIIFGLCLNIKNRIKSGINSSPSSIQ